MAANQPQDKDAIIMALRAELAAEKVRSATLEDQLKTARQQAAEIQAKIEIEEEYITNKLMKRLDDLKADKERLVRQVEREEELLTNTLQKKLNQLKQEKIDLQQLLEREEEYIVNKLQKQIQQVTNEKRELERRLEEQSDSLISTLHQGVQRVRDMEAQLGPEQSLLGSSQALDLVRKMTVQLDEMHNTQQKFISERELYKKKAQEMEERLKEVDHKNFLLEQQVLMEQEKHKKLIQSACYAEQDLEMNIDREVNAVRRGSRGSLTSPRDPTRSPVVHHRISSSPMASPLVPRHALPPDEILTDSLARQAIASHRTHFVRKLSRETDSPRGVTSTLLSFGDHAPPPPPASISPRAL